MIIERKIKNVSLLHRQLKAMSLGGDWRENKEEEEHWGRETNREGRESFDAFTPQAPPNFPASLGSPVLPVPEACRGKHNMAFIIPLVIS